MGSILNAVRAVLNFVGAVPAWLLVVITTVFLSLFDMGQDLLCWLLDQILGLVEGITAGFGFDFSLFDASRYSSIPAGISETLGLLGIGGDLAMIAAALIIRFLLQTIPFVRWGS